MQIMQQRFSQPIVTSARQLVCTRGSALARSLLVRSGNNSAPQTAEQPSTSTTTEVDVEKEVTKFTRQAAGTFAPRSSTKQKNPAVKGSLLYDIFEYQSWICLVAGGLLSFNIIWPTDEPSIPRLLGMWSIWMFTIPSLRAKECTAKEKDALNILFLLVPLMNVMLPFVWKSFAFIFTSNVIALGAVYWWKGVWKEVYGLPFAYVGVEAPGAAGADSGSNESTTNGSDSSA
ncbi:hypothetical protein Vretimale_3157 [Volvox reticuliferus]|uniref:Uncharacterized protein n=1 Tax=Volvox reticuliferus TaxID=1737510 RepID=A0A8J4D974_9CHLO|nr:hypothetical protein Vretifemale_6583 [Volvox reticuliferus]GIL97503.1 hypothetical protein Vretimale_3157 [Volvox reticuliferus]